MAHTRWPRARERVKDEWSKEGWVDMIDILKDLPPIGHIGYIVANRDSSVEMLQSILGIDNFILYDFVPKKAWVTGKEIFDCKLKIAVGVFKNNVKLEIIQPVSGATPHHEFLSKIGSGIHHIAFYSDRYDEWHEYFKARSAVFLFEMEAEDDVIGYRRSFYAEVEGFQGVLEITEIARKRKLA
jgi:hypothetical protein